jgi:hypothetical protein
VGRPGALILVLLIGAFAAPGEAAAPERLKLAQRLDLGVVAVEARVGGDAVHSSGTVVDGERGLVLTSARAVWGATSLKLSTGLGTLHGRIVARAPCDELALVETQPRLPGLVSMTSSAGSPPATGALVTAYGRRLALPGPALLTLPARVSSSPLELDAKLVPEAAGGPVLDAGGRVVGIATAEGGSIAWDAVQQRMRELRPGARRTFGGWRDQYGCSDRLNRLTRVAHPAFRRADARLIVPVPASRVPGTGRID